MKKENKYLKITVISLLLSSLSILLVMFAYDTHRSSRVNRAFSIIFVAVFYLFLILGYWFFFRLSRLRKEQEKQDLSDREKRRSRTKGRPGIIVFFSNRYSAAADVTMAISLVVTVVLFFVNRSLLAHDPLYETVCWRARAICF